MPKQSKRFRKISEKKKEDAVPIAEAVNVLKGYGGTKFDQSVEIAIRLGIDQAQADQIVRGSIVLPHGIGKQQRVLVFAKGAKAEEAKAAGADFVGEEDLADKIKGGWTDFDAVIATPDMMRLVGALGKVLGPRGLMPNPKTGTVTPNVAQAVKEIKAGKVEFRVDKTGIVHAPVGKMSFPAQNLIENASALRDSIVRAKPSASTGEYLKGITVSSTMGPGVLVDETRVEAATKR